MNVRLLLFLMIATPLLCACRRDPHMQVYIDNMNAEKRLLEDTMYELQYDYETKVAEVDKLRKELEDLKAGGPGTSPPSGGTPRGPRRDSNQESPRDLFPNIPDLKPPTIDEGTRRESGPQPTPEPDAEMDDLEPPKLDLGQDTSLMPAVPMPLDQQVASLYLHPALTADQSRDRLGGDDGLVILFEPRNRDDAFVPRPGRVSAVLLDAEKRQRLARWEFTEDQVEIALQKARTGRGIELALPWPGSSPSQGRLHLFVRYWLPDGTAVQADREVAIAAHGRLATRWTPRTEPRPAPLPERADIAEKTPPAPVGSDVGRELGRVPGEAGETPQVPEPVSEQAQLPLWRPYR